MVRTATGQGNCVDLLNIGSSLNSEFNEYAEYYVDQVREADTKKIIILEDDILSRKILESNIHLYDPQIHCFHATTEEEVIRILDAFKCHLILADYYLGGPKTGLEICNTVKDYFPDTERVIVSQLSDDQYKKLIPTEEGVPVSTFMHKPVNARIMNQFLNLIFGEMQNAW